MKSTIHQFNHMDPDGHLNLLSVSAGILMFYQATQPAVPWLQRPMPQCPTSQTCQLVQPSKDQMTLFFPCSASYLQELSVPSTSLCQKPSKNALEEGTLEKQNTVEQDKLKGWQKVK